LGYCVPKVDQSMTEEDEYKNDSDKQLLPVTILRMFLHSCFYPLDVDSVLIIQNRWPYIAVHKKCGVKQSMLRCVACMHQYFYVTQCCAVLQRILTVALG